MIQFTHNLKYEHPTWEDYEDFPEFRCMPRTRYGIKEELRNLPLDTYDPIQIIEKHKVIYMIITSGYS